MIKKIPQDFINNLLERTNIIDLINKQIKLKKKGNNYQALCPFHNEKTPSFTVSQEKQFYYCFGCGAHGNAIDFLMNYNYLKFVESIEMLALEHNIKIPNNTNITFNEQEYFYRQNIYNLMKDLSIFFQNELYSKKSMLARSFLKKRGLNKEIIKYFNIGFASFSYHKILDIFGNNVSKRNLLQESGMLTVHNNCYCNFFYGRIIFPIKNRLGQIIAFGGRSLDNKKPKYINSPETKIFQKNNYLYGMYEIQQKNKILSRIIIVEGYMDVISLFQFGINYAVATLGTSITKKHIQLLYRYTEQLICCYDGDESGDNASWKTLKIALPYLIDGRQLNFMILPKGKDPDIFIREVGKTIFEKHINQSLPLSIFLFNKLQSKINLLNSESYIKLGLLAIPLINQIPSKILRIYLRQKLSIKLGLLDDHKLEEVISKNKKNYYLSTSIKQTKMHIMLALLIQYPWLSNLVKKTDLLAKINTYGMLLFIKIVNICKSKPNINTSQLLEYFRTNKIHQQLEILATWNHMIDENRIESIFMDLLMNFCIFFLEIVKNILFFVQETIN